MGIISIVNCENKFNHLLNMNCLSHDLVSFDNSMNLSFMPLFFHLTFQKVNYLLIQ